MSSLRFNTLVLYNELTVNASRLVMLGFTGYLVFGLSVGLAYDKLIKNTPAFIVLYGLMLSSGNMGPGDVLGLARYAILLNVDAVADEIFSASMCFLSI